MKPNDQTTPHDHTEDGMTDTEGTVRSESWTCEGAAELELSIERGRLELTLAEDATSVEIEVRAEPMPEASRSQGLAGLFNWLSDAGGQKSFRFNRSFSLGDMKIADMKIGDVRLADLGLGDLGLGNFPGNDQSGERVDDRSDERLDPDELRERAV
jgi:hypothetical protein